MKPQRGFKFSTVCVTLILFCDKTLFKLNLATFKLYKIVKTIVPVISEWC